MHRSMRPEGRVIGARVIGARVNQRARQPRGAHGALVIVLKHKCTCSQCDGPVKPRTRKALAHTPTTHVCSLTHTVCSPGSCQPRGGTAAAYSVYGLIEITVVHVVLCGIIMLRHSKTAHMHGGGVTRVANTHPSLKQRGAHLTTPQPGWQAFAPKR